MNKQEVIMKLEEKDNNAYEKQQAYLTGSALFQRYEAQRIAYRTAINFDNEEAALYTVYITGGTVEQVEV